MRTVIFAVEAFLLTDLMPRVASVNLKHAAIDNFNRTMSENLLRMRLYNIAFAGIIAFVWPVGTAGVLLLFIAAWAIATGILQIWGAIRLRKEIEGEWLLILSGAISIIFGLVLVMQPLAGAVAVIWMIATFAIIFGIDHILLAFKLRSYRA